MECTTSIDQKRLHKLRERDIVGRDIRLLGERNGEQCKKLLKKGQGSQRAVELLLLLMNNGFKFTANRED
jgi:hypothetical protein